MKERYEKFLETKQAPLKLRIALEEYFFSGVESGEEECRGYESYLRRRVRPAAQMLMEWNRTGEILEMEEAGWLGERELDEMIGLAADKGKAACWMALVKRKAEHWGFPDRDFSL